MLTSACSTIWAMLVGAGRGGLAGGSFWLPGIKCLGKLLKLILLGKVTFLCSLNGCKTVKIYCLFESLLKSTNH